MKNKNLLCWIIALSEWLVNMGLLCQIKPQNNFNTIIKTINIMSAEILTWIRNIKEKITKPRYEIKLYLLFKLKMSVNYQKYAIIKVFSMIKKFIY